MKCFSHTHRQRSKITLFLLVYCFFGICYISSFRRTSIDASVTKELKEETTLKEIVKEFRKENKEKVKVEKEITPLNEIVKELRKENEDEVKAINLKREEREEISNEAYDHPRNPGFPLSGSLKSPKPAYVMGTIEKYADIVIGVPTVKRENASYLIQTIRSLLDNQLTDDVQMFIVVFIADINITYVEETSRDVIKTFRLHPRFNQIQIIGPPANYYPNWRDTVQRTHKDTLQRSLWRSKQNLDQIFLMMYIYQYFPTYYLMMEDDVVAERGYLINIYKEAHRRKDKPWFFISFCTLGAIGKLLRTSTLPSVASFIHTFWNRQPLDWLLLDYVQVTYCSHDDRDDQCVVKRNRRLPIVVPALFQHKGKYSSLSGKVQELKDHTFHKDLKELRIKAEVLNKHPNDI